VLAVYVCRHPRHQRTTEVKCRTCVDFLFPVLTPQTPVDAVERLRALPPRPQPEGWWLWPNVQEAQQRAARAFIAAIPPFPGGFTGRGVVMVGGGSYFPSAYVSIRVLRHIGCSLPLQLWHLDGEMTEPMRELVRPFGVECVNADAVAQDHPFRFLDGHWWKGWQLKSYAIAHSPFEEVLLLDADCYPTRDPGFLFSWPPYQEHGAIFWPDREASHLTDEHWRILGIEPCGVSFESGQLVVNKRLCWRELQLALWYNAHADYVYQHLWGDKDTFNVAWRQLGRSYAMPRHSCSWDVHTILQFDPDGAVLFQHRCRDKFRLGETTFTSTPQFWNANCFNPRLAHEELCFRYLNELARCWTP
jgi:hypothetical protein